MLDLKKMDFKNVLSLGAGAAAGAIVSAEMGNMLNKVTPNKHIQGAILIAVGAVVTDMGKKSKIVEGIGTGIMQSGFLNIYKAVRGISGIGEIGDVGEINTIYAQGQNGGYTAIGTTEDIAALEAELGALEEMNGTDEMGDVAGDEWMGDVAGDEWMGDSGDYNVNGVELI